MAQQQSQTSAPDGHRSKLQETRSQTGEIGRHAAQAGETLRNRAVGQGRQTAAEAGRQAQNLLGQASAQLSEQASAQQKRAAARLRDLGDEFESMSSRDERHGMAGDLAQRAAEKAHTAADWLEHREPGAVVAEVRNFARRHPGTFLAGAALAGLLAGRLSRSLTAGQGSGGAGPGGAGGGSAGDRSAGDGSAGDGGPPRMSPNVVPVRETDQ